MTKSDVSAIIDQMNRNNALCQGAAQQVANGYYRLFDILQLIAFDLDENNAHAEEISAITASFYRNEGFCQSAPQQSANGVYRVVEMMEVLVKILDTSGSQLSAASSVLDSMRINEGFCQSAPQQIANGAYRAAEMAQVLADTLISDSSSVVSDLISAMNSMNSLCQGAPQQSANGTGTLAQITELLVRKLDKKNKYSSTLDIIVALKERNNSLCQGADQQSGNYLYRTVEMVQLITNIMLDEADARTEQYWQEHPMERDALLAEKAQNQEQINQIEDDAAQINDNGATAPILQEIQQLRDERDNFCQDELLQLQKQVELRKAERSAIGVFKFSERKAAAAKVDEAIAAVSALQRKIDQQRSVLLSEINKKQQQIDNINAQVEAAREKVLARRAPYTERINQIDRELTRRR